MQRFLTLLIFFGGILFSSYLYAQDEQVTETTTTTTKQTASGPVTVEKRTIVTTTPEPKEVIETPSGFVSCENLSAGWYNDVWVAGRRVCKYANSPLGLDYVQGYWTCSQYTIETGECNSWNWVSPHWEKAYTGY